MKNYYLGLTLAIFACSNIFGQNTSFKTGQDVFGTRNFIENNGQFNNSLPKGSPGVIYALESGNDNIYFTAKGPVYRLIKIHAISEEEKERAEAGKKFKMKPNVEKFVFVNWLNSNPDIQVEESQKQGHYFTYGEAKYNSACFKKITYKNVYNGIDLVYEIPDNSMHGVKYNVVVHPGANLVDVKMAYSGDVDKMTIKDGNVIIKTPIDDLMESAPVSFYDNLEALKSNFTLHKNVISFNFPAGYDNTRTLIIDPWVTNITTLNNSNTGFDVDYDYFGNVFVYGGNNNVSFNPCKEAKYTSGGVLLWTFSGQVIAQNWVTGGTTNTASNFCVNRGTGKSYLGQGWSTTGGVRIIRIDVNGVYDNFITPADNSWVEVFEMGFHCGSGNVYGMGGSTNSKKSGGLVDQITANLVTVSFNSVSPSPSSHDIACSAIDDQGSIFIHYQSSQAAMRNQLALLNPAFTNTVWMTSSTYSLSLGYFSTKTQFINPGGAVSSNAFNCLAVNANYLFYYDGLNLAAYNKANGVKIAFITIPAHPVRSLAGIAVDDCNNLYVGGNGNILSYNFNGTNFNPLPSIPVGGVSPNQAVYDIKFDRNTNLLHVCGSGFLGSYNAINSGTCAIGNQFVLTPQCNGFNNGTGVATVTTSIPNPTINYIWSNGGGTVSTTFSTGALSNTVGNLTNGIYTVQIQVNAPCGPVYVNTISINCCPAIAITPSFTQAGCTNTLNGASLAVSGQGTLVPTITWNPIPGALAGNSLSATNLPAGTTTITLNFGFGCVNTITVNMLPAPPPVTFTINNLTGSYSVTCTNPAINLAAVSNYTYGPLTYSWTSPSFTANTSTVSINTANTLTLTVTDLATGCLSQQSVAIGMNTVAPTSTVAPSSQAITCNSGSPVTFTSTITSPTVNMQHDWYSPLNPLPGGVPIATSNNSISILSGNIPPGTYTVCTTNLVNGCQTCRNVTITSLSAWPTFNVLSTTNFSVGCSPLNTTTIIINNPVSTQSPAATCSYTFLAPSFTGAVTPSVVLGGNTSTVTTIPGTWTVIVQDNSNWCRTTLSIPIVQNTVAPNVSASMFTQTLTCKNPTVIGTGTSTTANTQINWGVPAIPPLLSTSTLVIGPPNGPNTSTTSLTYATYTVIATNTVNACQSTSIVTINQNFRPPVSSPTISIGTPTAIYCIAITNPAVLTTGASTVTSGVPFAFVANPCWTGPSPQASVCGASSYSCYVPGVYTLTVEDSYNGCTTSGTINILDRTQPPVITEPAATATLDCAADKANLLTAMTGTSTGGLRFWYYAYPTGAAFTPNDAIIPNGGNPLLSGTSATNVGVSLSGTYYYVATNTLTGCQAYGLFNVNDGVITAAMSVDKEFGYAPLTVNFTNNSSSSLGSSSITSVWSFGNGTSQTATTTIGTSATYPAPGSYTVMLISSKGSCLDTAYKVIKVDLPSKLETPNVFTPNGDGSNDVFFLKVANITEVKAVIVDRWGNKVYEVISSTGNIAWDGKNLQGKECAAGVYFYIITGEGKDDKEYESKGNVSLFR